MKISLFVSMCLFVPANLAQAQSAHSSPSITTTDDPPPLAADSQEPPKTAAGVFISSDARTNSSSHRTCVDVQIGEEKSYGCINEQLRQQVDKFNPGVPSPPLDAKSQDIHIGIVNVPAIKQQYGENFGRSVIPSRPPPLIFTSPLSRVH